MATTSRNLNNADLYKLSADQQDLLLAALSSNSNDNNHKQMSNFANPNNMSFQGLPAGSSLFAPLSDSPLQQTPGSGSMGLDDSPFLDYDLDFEGNYDFDDITGQGSMIGALPGGESESPEADEDHDGSHDKRKNSDDGSEEDGGGKRREGDDKQAKKPGRKPLTSEPTSVSGATSRYRNA
jgi:AP-1-like transcription factor